MGALDGIRIVSLNHFLSGPAAAQFLGDMGADVIAVEPLNGAFQRNWAVANHFVDDTSVNHMTTGRNKRSIAVDLKSPEGIAVIKRLIRQADVVMENFRPGTLDRLGLSDAAMRAENPRLIIAVSTGFGQDGPYRDRPGQDVLIQAMSGLAAHTGPAEGGPVAVGTVPIDQHTATIYASAILAALFERERTGIARRVEVNMLQAALDLQAESIVAWMNGAPRRSPRGGDGLAAWFSPAPYGLHAAGDGHLILSMASPQAIAEALEMPELADYSAEDCFSKSGEINRLVAARLEQETLAFWLPRLEAAGVWHEVVRDYDSLKDNPQLRHLSAFLEARTQGGSAMTVLAHPIRYDGEAPAMRLPPQPLGGQTREVLAEIGYSGDEIEALVAARAVAATSRMRG